MLAELRPAKQSSARALPGGESRPVTHDVRWTVGVVVLFLASSIEPSRFGLQTEGDIDVLRWLLLIPLYTGPLVVVACWTGVRSMLRGPFGLMVAAAAAMLIVAPLGDSPPGDVLAAIGALSLALMGGLIYQQLGFSRTMDLLGNVTLVLCIYSFFDGSEAIPGRLSGAYPASNALGIHGSLLVLDGVRRFLRQPAGGRGGVRRQLPLLPVAMVLVGLASLLAAQSRVAMLASFAAVIVLIHPHLTRRFGLSVLGGVVGLFVAVLAAGFGGAVARRLSRTGDVEELTSFTGRTDVWDRVIDLIVERPFTGYGFNGSTAIFERELELGNIAFDASEAHNFILQIAMNGGIVAALLMTAAFVSYLSRSRWRPDPIVSSFVMLVVVNGLTESIVREPKDFWILLAVAFAASSAKPLPRPVVVGHSVSTPAATVQPAAAHATVAPEPSLPSPPDDKAPQWPSKRLRKSRRTAQMQRHLGGIR